MSKIDLSVLEKLLSRVQKPGRYMGGELNCIVKDEARLRMALSYPDLYEIGMSNNGLRILYDTANRVPGVACERVFAVADDMDAALREAGVPLFTLETRTPLRELDILGFNVSHELLATNILAILDRGGIPLRRLDRGVNDPVIIAGGEAVSNPFPLSDFIDAFYLGDGEEGISEIAAAALRAKEGNEGRNGIIERIGAIEGVLIPARYAMTVDGNGRALVEGPAVRRRVYRGRDPVDPVRPLVPNIRVSQERAVIEVTRGCSNFCNFCHSGFYDLPYRSYDPRNAASRLFEIVANTGYNEVTLSSLSISDYPRFAGLINEVLPKLTEMGVSVSLPSLRVDRATLPVIEQVSELRRASLTFAVESASERIRARANKKLYVDDLAAIVRHVFERGWKVIKLYFMIGLPGCEEHDEADGIISLMKDLSRIGGKGLEINVTVSPFVPKPHTPFQWERQMGRDYFEETVRRIKRGLPRFIKIKNHDVEASILEGILTRGDWRLGEAILRSYRDGCRFDSWDEHFKFQTWMKNIGEVIPEWQTLLDHRGNGCFPWDVIDTGFRRLVEKRRDAVPAEGVLAPRTRANPAAVDVERVREAREKFERSFQVTGRIRIRFSKTGLMRFIPQIDFVEIIKRGLRMAGAPVAMTQGFNKRERISTGFPLPLGIESEAELVEVELYGDVSADLLARLNARLPQGIAALEVRAHDERVSLMALTGAVDYRVTLPTAESRDRMIGNMRPEFEFIKRTKKGEQSLRFDSVVISFEKGDDNSVLLRLHAGSEGGMRADHAVTALLKADSLEGVRIVKTAQFRKEGDSFVVIT